MVDPVDREAFFNLIADVRSFYSKDFSEFIGNIWWNAMIQFDLAAVADAMTRHCANPDTGQYMPMPADVVRMLQGSTQDSALVAWAKVDRIVRTVGTYQSVVFDDALVHRVLSEMGGWIALGTKNESDWPFIKNEFVTRYRGYRGRSEVPEYPPVLVGIAEAGNSTQGFGAATPMLIGDADRASLVMCAGSKRQLLPMRRMDAAPAAAALRLVDTRGAK